MSNIDIDWSKAPEGTTGAMMAHFDGGGTRRGDVEFIPSDEPFRSIYKEGPDSWVYHPAPSAIHWTGEGLPPAGTVCEVLNNTLDRPEWERCTILFMGKFKAIYESESCHERVADVSESWMISFRPIRTPEQIASEEREKEDIRSLASAIHKHAVYCRLPMSDFGAESLAMHLYADGCRVAE